MGFKIRPSKRKFIVHWIFRKVQSTQLKTQFQYNQVKLPYIHILARLAYLISVKPPQAFKETGQNQNWTCFQLLKHNPNEAPVWLSISSYPLLMYNSKFSSSFRWGDLTSLFPLRYFYICFASVLYSTSSLTIILFPIPANTNLEQLLFPLTV